MWRSISIPFVLLLLVPMGGSNEKEGFVMAEETVGSPRNVSKEHEAVQKGGKDLPLVDPSSGKPIPLSIDSDEMTVKGPEGKVLFNGAVKIQRGDVTLKADAAEVFLVDSDASSNSGTTSEIMKGKQITKIEVARHVELIQGNRRVSAQRGVYDAARQELVFSGDPEMWEEGYRVRGKVITLSLAQKRSIVEGSRLTIN